MIRKARLDDIDQVYEIYRAFSIDRSRLDDFSYQADIQKRGFVLGLTEKESNK